MCRLYGIYRHIITQMKHLLATTMLVLGILVFPAFSFAQTPAPTPGIFDTTNTPLVTRKAYVDTNLRDLLTRLNAVHTRVQVTSARLGTNGIDITASNVALSAAQSDLVNAKVALDAFTATPVDDKPATITTLRSQAKTAEEALKSARAHIIESITALQLTLQTQ